MLQKIIQFSIHQKLMVVLGVVALIAWGTYALSQLPIDAIPDITNNQVQVITQAPSLAAQETEQFITFPLETTLRNVPGVTEIRSISRFGLSVITVVFEEATPTLQARQLVTEQLKTIEAELTAGKPQLAPITTGLGEIYQYVVRPKEGFESQYSATDLRTIQDWLIKRQLAGVPGVVDISSLGGYLKEYEVSIDPERLRGMNTTLTEVVDALSTNNANTGGSYIEKGPEAFFIRGEGMVKSPDEIGQIVVKNLGPTPVLVRDVAQVGFGHAVRYGAMTRNGRGEVVGGIVLMLKGASSEKTIEGVKSRMADIQKSLPPGLVIEPFQDRKVLIDKAIHTVTKNLLEGGLIVMSVLLLLLGNWRAGLVVASVIPLCMLFALGMMHVFGVSANLMSLGAIDFGLLVDGAVIIVESMIFQIVHTRASRSQSMDEIALDSASRLMRSALFGQLIILIVYFPILSLTGIEGKMFRPMALTVGFAIIGAMLLCVTYVPMMAATLLRQDIQEEGTLADRIMKALYRVYAPLLTGSLRWQKSVLAASVLLLAGTVGLFGTLGGEFIPNLDEGDIAISLTLKPGSSLSQTIETTRRLETILKSGFPEVKEVISKIGTAEIPTDPMPIEAADVIVVLKDQADWTTASTKEELLMKMERALRVLPGLNLEFTQPIQLRFNELMTGVKSDIAVKIYGEDLAILFKKANQAAAKLTSIPGVADLKVEQISGLPQMLVSYNRPRLAQYGVSVASLNRILKTAFAGETAGVVFEGEKRFDLVARLDSTYRQDIDNIRQLYVDLPNGQQVPLDQLATISYQNAPMQISRDNARRRITLGINVRGRDVESLVGEMKTILEKEVPLPAGYSYSYGGQFENLVKAKERLAIAVPLALVLIGLLLFFTFGSMAQALMIFSAIPLSAIGGVLALWVRGMPFSISAGVGFIALFGIAVLNGIVLISYFNQLAEEGITDVVERVKAGTAVRFRPVVMTAAVASLGFLPMALSSSAGAEVQKPLATVVIGGLVSATLLTLVVLPVLYSLVTSRSVRRRESGRQPTVLQSLAGLFLLAGLASPTTARSQSTPAPLSIDQAITVALQNNGALQASNLGVRVTEQLTKTAWDIPRTTVDYQRGQIQSYPIDHSLVVMQSLAMPSVYVAQKKLNQSQQQLAQQQAALHRTELIREIRSVFYTLRLNYERLSLFQAQDTLYQRASRAAGIRYRTGETNQLERVTAETRQRDIQNRLAVLQSEIGIGRQQLAMLLQVNEPVVIDTTSSMKVSQPLLPAALESTPILALQRAHVELSRRQINLEQQRFWPDVRVGYLSQSIERRGGFGVYQVGVSLPLFLTPLRARLEAARLQGQIADRQLMYQQHRLRGELSIREQQYRQSVMTLSYYETSALPQANLILRTAERSYLGGDIEYVEFVQSTTQAWLIREQYLDALAHYNQSIIEQDALTGYSPKAP
ncbi:CusA/CzcA family heavy metal efflux RND transporter [Spirosoma sp. KCTC 42546]|uniref:CusA/CzcA family heavy metal efflux RND transporter n=1 Tax=Spirosoma sp. KCTC 42546 TaxID=2520506 RepID=UPI00115AC14D|nr:CusA/CzcA family heavy metal efflux RND transporter [Spirosoma sp. KCTC 42546]QDK80052.1 CusA/CzcA family heavy metal efflux RND transporter [Spirosoma sp. KCTC 42546]